MQSDQGAVIIGWGSALPDKVVTNHELCQHLDTSDAWIQERTGIRERRVGGTTAELAIAAGRRALALANVDPSSVDLLILATTTPDQCIPATSTAVQQGLGLRGGAFDLNAACAGFTYALVTAAGFLKLGYRRVLVIGADTMSRVIDWNDRNTAVLFGDGAGAVLVEACDGPGQLLGWHLDCEGALGPLLYADLGGYLKMSGKEVFRHAVRVLVESSQRSLAMAGISAEQVSLLVPHQANLRIIETAAERLGIPGDRAALVLDRTGNTSSASIPLALVDAIEKGRVSDGDYLLLVGFGAGMTVASTVIRWSQATPRMPLAP